MAGLRLWLSAPGALVAASLTWPAIVPSALPPPLLSPHRVLSGIFSSQPALVARCVDVLPDNRNGAVDIRQSFEIRSASRRCEQRLPFNVASIDVDCSKAAIVKTRDYGVACNNRRR